MFYSTRPLETSIGGEPERCSTRVGSILTRKHLTGLKRPSTTMEKIPHFIMNICKLRPKNDFKHLALNAKIGSLKLLKKLDIFKRRRVHSRLLETTHIKVQVMRSCSADHR